MNTTIKDPQSPHPERGGLTPRPSDFLSLREAAAEIVCSRRFLETRIEDGELKVFRPSKRLVRIQRSELERWVESYSSKGSVKS